jgi:hypothetical protein
MHKRDGSINLFLRLTELAPIAGVGATLGNFLNAATLVAACCAWQ